MAITVKREARELNLRKKADHDRNMICAMYRQVHGINPSLRRQREDMLELQAINKQLTGYDL